MKIFLFEIRSVFSNGCIMPCVTPFVLTLVPMQFSALNSDSNHNQASHEDLTARDALSITREAVESEAFKSYYSALSLQQQGKLCEARDILISVLSSPYLAHSLQDAGSKISSELLKGKAAKLKLASLRNLACIAEGRECWSECISWSQQALEIDDSDTMLWFRLGRASLRVCELELSAYSLSRAVSRASYLSPARRVLIPVLYAIYRYDECLSQCSEQLRVTPHSELARDYANWILKSLPYADHPKTQPIESLLQHLHSVSLSDLESSPHLQHGNELRRKQKLAFPVNPVQEPWAPACQLSSLCWADLGAYLLSAFAEAEGARGTLRPCRVSVEETALGQRDDVAESSKAEDAERKTIKRRAPDLIEEAPPFKRRSLRSSQQESRDRDILNKELYDLVADFFAPKWAYFQESHCMSAHPSHPKKISPPVVEQKLLFRSQPALEGEEDRVREFLRSHDLSPICSLLVHFLKSSAQIFLLSWTQSSNQKLQSLLSEMYLICHTRFLTLPNIMSDGSLLSSHPSLKLETAYVVLMFLEITVDQNLPSHSGPDADPLLSQSVLEAAHFLEEVSRSPLVPSRDWYTFFLRSAWALSRLSEHRGLVDKQLVLLDQMLQVFELYNTGADSVASLDSHCSDSSSNMDGFSLEYPPDELTLVHSNIHTVINRSLVMDSIEKAMTSHSIDRGILFDYYLRGNGKFLLNSIKSFLSNSPKSPFRFLLVPMEKSKSELKPNLIQVALECINSFETEDPEAFSLLNKILSNLVVSISDSLDLPNDVSTSIELETEVVTLSDVIALFVSKSEQSVSFGESDDLVGYIWSLLRILQFYWDIQDISLKTLLPISPVICLLFHCLKNSDAHVATDLSVINLSEMTSIEDTACVVPLEDTSSSSNDKRTQKALKRLASFNPGLAFLFECHEMFGSERLCSSHQGMLLHLLLRETGSALEAVGESDSCLRDSLESELTQILFCLFGYPAKRYKILGLSEHRDSEDEIPPFHWPSCYLMLSYLRPASLPTFDDNKSTGISPDLTIICKRVADQLPYVQHTVVSEQLLQSFIQSEAEEFPQEFESTSLSKEAECLAMAFYVIADEYLKWHSNRAIEFYTKHLLFYPKHTDSWAGLALANFRKFQYMLDNRKITEAVVYVSEIEESIVSVFRCFTQANRLYPSHSQLLEKFGQFCFQANSFWRHLHSSTSLLQHLESSHTFPDTQTELKQSLSVFQKALDFDTHIAEPWLYHYLLAKIKKKLHYPHEECFSHLISSSRILQTDGASYPELIDCNSTGSAVEAVEVHYMIHSMFVKSLLKDGMAAVSTVETALLSLKEATPLARIPPTDTAITQCLYEKRSQIFQTLNFHQETVRPASLEDRFISVLIESIHGLVTCLSRFPTHYKSHYRLAKTLWDLNREIFYQSVKSLLVGPISPSDIKNDKQLPLFSLKSNLFTNMWAFKSWDINRPGSFVYHMYRHVSLLFSFLSYRHSAEAFISVVSLLKLKPEFHRTYLREYERIQLYQAGLLLTARALENVCSEGLTVGPAKPFNLLKASYILYSFSLSSALPPTVRDQLVERVCVMLQKYYRLYRGPPPQEGEYPLSKVLSYCAMFTAGSSEAQHPKKPKLIKPKPPIIP